MYCADCGQQRPDDGPCANCNGGIQSDPPVGKVENYLIPSIFATLCCCLPFGIVALVYSAQVNSRFASGDIAGAQLASNRAKLWMKLAIGLRLAVAVEKVITKLVIALTI
jgi:hypothetical protein